MKNNRNLSKLRAAGFGLLAAAALMACSEDEFVRDAGKLPAPAGNVPTGALYARGSFDPQLQDFTISGDTRVEVVYRLDFPAPSDVTVTLAPGDENDVEDINDARGIKDGNPSIPMVLAPYKRYHLLPETNYALPQSLELTVPQGKTESAPLLIDVVYDDNLLPTQPENGKRQLWPWMLPLKVEAVDGGAQPAVDGQTLGIGIRSANSTSEEFTSYITWDMVTELEPKEEPFTFITYCDCREYDPSCAIYYYYARAKYEIPDGDMFLSPVAGTERHSLMFDVELLHPAFVTADARTGLPLLEANSDLMYVLNHQGRYIDPQRELGMKVCVSVETGYKSPIGFCNLSDEERGSLVWQIEKMVDTYGLDGVALNDAPADYTAAAAAPVDKASYTKLLKALRDALGADKLIMVSYDADANSALYEAHDGLRAGDYIDFAWWGTANEFCTPYADTPTCKPIVGLDVKKFSPMKADAVETETYKDMFTEMFSETGVPYTRSAVPVLKELNDKGQCSVLVYATLRADIQGFYEGGFQQVPAVFGEIPLHEGDMTNDTPGWISQGFVNESTMKRLAHFNGYGSGLKDW